MHLVRLRCVLEYGIGRGERAHEVLSLVPGKPTAHAGVEWCGGCEGESSVLRFGSAERRPKWQKLGWKSLDEQTSVF